MSSSSPFTTQEDHRIIHLREKHHLGWDNLHTRFNTESLGPPRSRDELRLRWLDDLRHRPGGPGKSGKGWKSKGVPTAMADALRQISRTPSSSSIASPPSSDSLSSIFSAPEISDTVSNVVGPDAEDAVQSDADDSNSGNNSSASSSSPSESSSIASPAGVTNSRNRGAIKSIRVENLLQREASRDFQQIQLAISRIRPDKTIQSKKAAPSMGQPKGCGKSGEILGKKQRSSRVNGKQNGRATYEPLHLSSNQNWVLFDPLCGFPAGPGPPPPAFQRLSTYTPGNVRILEYNIVSKSVRARQTPAELVLSQIEYTKQGPKIIGNAPVSAPSVQSSGIQRPRT